MTGALLSSTVWPWASRTTTTGWAPKAMVAPESEGSVVKDSRVPGPEVLQEFPVEAARAVNAADAAPSGATARANAVNTATRATAAEPAPTRTTGIAHDRRALTDSGWGPGGPAASPGPGSGPEPVGASLSSGGGRRADASAAAIATAPRVSISHIPSCRNAPMRIQIEGRPIQGISRRPMLMMSDREIGVLSGLGLASPAVTSVPSLFSATRRCSTRPPPVPTRVPSLLAATIRGGTGSLLAEPAGAWNVMTRPIGVGASAASGSDRTTSPLLMCGSIEPLWTTEPVSPNSIGTRAQAVRAARKVR